MRLLNASGPRGLHGRYSIGFASSVGIPWQNATPPAACRSGNRTAARAGCRARYPAPVRQAGPRASSATPSSNARPDRTAAPRPAPQGRPRSKTGRGSGSPAPGSRPGPTAPVLPGRAGYDSRPPGDATAGDEVLHACQMRSQPRITGKQARCRRWFPRAAGSRSCAPWLGQCSPIARRFHRLIMPISAVRLAISAGAEIGVRAL